MFIFVLSLQTRALPVLNDTGLFTKQISMETTNNIRYSVTKKNKAGNTVIIKIRLNDECKNGHNDFAITGEEYEKGKPLTDRNCIRCGAMGDDLAEWFPEFKIFNDLHLCDAKGAPMYAQGNGYYHMTKSSKEVAMSYLRITEYEYSQLAKADDQQVFTYLLDQLKIPARWEAEALEAIAELERLTGKKFVDDSTRYQFTPLTADEALLIEQRIESGYYTPEAINARKWQAIEDKKMASYRELCAQRDKEISKANNEFNVLTTILLMGLPINNVIYYVGSNKVVFNWKSWDDMITQEQFDSFISKVNRKYLPTDIKFQFGEDKK